MQACQRFIHFSTYASAGMAFSVFNAFWFFRFRLTFGASLARWLDNLTVYSLMHVSSRPFNVVFERIQVFVLSRSINDVETLSCQSHHVNLFAL